MKKIISFALLTFVALAFSGMAPGAHANQSVSSDTVAVLTLKVLTFDRNLEARSGGKVVIGLIYSDADLGHAEELKSSFDAYKGKKINGLDHDTVIKKYDGEENLAKWLDEKGVSVLYLSPSLLPEAETLHGLSVPKKCMTLGASRVFPEKGTSMGFDEKDGKPLIVIRLERSREEGVDFAANLLKMAEII